MIFGGRASVGLVQIGFAVPISGSWATPGNTVALARRAEELGYASLWTFQRLLVPLDSDSPRWAPQYRQVDDPIVTLAHLAAVTTTPRLGVAVLNMPFFSPILLAKQLTTLDRFSGGRLDVGLGIGWAAEEYQAAGAPFERRGARADEFLRCLETIWTQDEVEFHGEFYDVPRSRVAPKPVQQPRPPVILGGTAPAALQRAGRLADGWVSSSQADLTRIGDSIAVVRAAAGEAGRDPAALRFVVRGVVKMRPVEGERKPLQGTAEQIRGDLDMLATQGVTEVFVDLNFDPVVGSPEADATASLAYAHEVLDALAP